MTDYAWSYSRLVNSETCPAKYAAISVYKTVKDEDSNASAEGQRWHNALAARVRNGTPLPLPMRWMEPLMQKLMATPGVKMAEEQLAITKKLKPTGWFSNDVWCRSIFDFTIENGDRAVTIDWKTGKHVVEDHTQQRIASAILLIYADNLKEVAYSYYYTQHRKMLPAVPGVVKRSEVKQVFNELADRIGVYNDMHTAGVFPPRENAGCRWCPVRSCKFNKRKY